MNAIVHFQYVHHPATVALTISIVESCTYLVNIAVQIACVNGNLHKNRHYEIITGILRIS